MVATGPDANPAAVCRSRDPVGGFEKARPPGHLWDAPWSAGHCSVTDVQNASNLPRTAESSRLGSPIAMITLPSRGRWDAMSNSERAPRPIDRDRVQRGVQPLRGVGTKVQGTALGHARYLLDQSRPGRPADGRDPWGRLNGNPAINARHDLLSRSENLFALMTCRSSTPLPVERSVHDRGYLAASSARAERHTGPWHPCNDNTGPVGMEGFLGPGRSGGGPWQGWPAAETLVMKAFDPCATWASAT